MEKVIRKKSKVLLSAGLIVALSIFSGCSSTTTNNSSEKENPGGLETVVRNGKEYKKITFAHGTSSCEAPVFSAETKGFFEEEGLEVELVKMDFETLKNGVASGKVDATVGNFAWFKPIEQGLDVKLTGGLHAGCIQALASKASGVKSIKDLKGKVIGIDQMGGGPHITLSIELKKAGIDPKKDVEWRVYPGQQLKTAAEKGEIAAYITWDPAAQQAFDTGEFTRLLNIAQDEPYKSGYCCYTVISGRLAKEDPETAAALTRALLKSAEWVGSHPSEAAEITASGKHVAADAQTIDQLICGYTWKPGVKAAKESIKFFINEQIKQGVLDPKTDPDELFDKIYFEAIPDYKGN